MMNKRKLRGSIPCSCVVCKKELTVAGIHTHVMRAHLKLYTTLGNTGGSGNNQYTKAKELGLPLPQLSAAGRSRIVAAMTARNAVFWTEVARKKHSDRMSQVVEDNPASYSHLRGGKRRCGVHWVDSTWEADFIVYCEHHVIEFQRKCGYFRYMFGERERKYFPDFYLPTYDVYVEVKGYKTDKDAAKWTQFPHVLKVVDSSVIDLVKDLTLDVNFFRK